MKKFFNNLSARILASSFIGLSIFVSSANAMNLSAPIKIGEIGFPLQAPYDGFVMSGFSHNTGKVYIEKNEIIGQPVRTYKKGIVKFGYGKDALYCKYDFNSQDAFKVMQFGGENDFILDLDNSYREIFKFDDDNKTVFYALYFNYCTSDLKIIGRSESGEWKLYIDSKKITERYFGGHEGYKEEDGVIYDKPKCNDDKIIVPYRKWHWQGESEPEGEFNFTWNDRTQQFDIKRIIY